MERLAASLEATALLLRRFDRAWKYYWRLHYTWRCAWRTAGWQ